MNDKCPNCKSSNTYFNGTLYVCICCQYEWIGKAPKGMPEKDARQSMKEENKDKKFAGY